MAPARIAAPPAATDARPRKPGVATRYPDVEGLAERKKSPSDPDRWIRSSIPLREGRSTMKKMLLGLAVGVACLAGLATAGEAGAAVVRKTTVVKRYGHDRGSNYYREHGTKYNGGYYFSG